jgi:hypothetical protein
MDEMKFGIIAAPLPADSRYRALLRRVVEKLPDGWDEFRTYGVELEAGKPKGHASALRFEAVESHGGEDEARSEQTWVVTLYPEWLDGFNDTAVMWVIAHELGHVASGCRCGIVVDGRRMTRAWGTEDSYREIGDAEAEFNERMADSIARAWGFWQEEAAFEETTRGGA